METTKPAAAHLDDGARAMWTRLKAMPLGPPGEGLSFEQRVARDNGWSNEFTARACTEYRRFVFLCRQAGRALTPSDAVDQVWHLHLCYSRSYWHRMCREILGQPLHHGPTRGGDREADKFVDWYGATLESYAEVFGEAPPVDIWPAIRARFANAGAWRRVNTAENWVVSRDRVRRGGRVAAVLLFLALICVGCGFGGDDSGIAILIFCFLGFLFFRWIFSGGGRGRRGGGGGGCGGGCGFFGGGWGGDSSGGDGGCGGGCGGD